MEEVQYLCGNEQIEDAVAVYFKLGFKKLDETQDILTMEIEL